LFAMSNVKKSSMVAMLRLLNLRDQSFTVSEIAAILGLLRSTLGPIFRALNQNLRLIEVLYIDGERAYRLITEVRIQFPVIENIVDQLDSESTGHALPSLAALTEARVNRIDPVLGERASLKSLNEVKREHVRQQRRRDWEQFIIHGPNSSLWRKMDIFTAHRLGFHDPQERSDFMTDAWTLLNVNRSKELERFDGELQVDAYLRNILWRDAIQKRKRKQPPVVSFGIVEDYSAKELRNHYWDKEQALSEKDFAIRRYAMSEVNFDVRELVASIIDGIRFLKSEHRALVHLMLKGHDQNEIATNLGIDPNAAKQRKFRVIRRLRKLLDLKIAEAA
jgi:RNA polymerase sigma factor (sigma-70 family)